MSRWLRRTRSPVAVIALVPLLAVPTISSATRANASGSSDPVRTPAAVTAPGSEAAALQRAQTTKKAVAITAMTTGTSTSVAEPSGAITTTTTVLPTQAMVDGVWTPFNANLQQNSAGTLSPILAANGLTVSDGGTGPLATLTNEGTSLSISWPGSLPTPTVSGPTASYANVLPGINLDVTASTQGGISEVLDITTANAAEDPGLVSLTIPTTSLGTTLTRTSEGTFAAIDAHGDQLFSAPAPEAWDSSTTRATASVTSSHKMA